jgi:hypothetical protein
MKRFKQFLVWCLRELRKRIDRRIHWWYAWTILLILVDEYIKEGYVFNPDDFLKPLTHENLILLTTVAYTVVSTVIVVRRGRSSRLS